MKSLLIILLVICSASVWSQEDIDPIKQNIIELRIEVIAEQFEEEEIDFTTLFDELSYYYDHPLDLNQATSEELRSLFLLTDRQILILLRHRKYYGTIQSIFELMYLPGFDRSTIEFISPFITVKRNPNGESVPLKSRLQNGKSQMLIRYQRVLEEQQGYSPIDDSTLALFPNRRYLGSADKVYMRYRYQYRNDLSFGLTAEKDAGEEFFTGTQKNGFDFYSAHLYLRNVGIFKKVVLGDYQVQFGQGLTTWSGLAFGKSAIIRNIKKTGVGLKPYASVDENIFMRGGAATLKLKQFELTAFGSYKNVDGNITESDTTDLTDEVTFSSLQRTGYHRTPGEVEDKDVISELNTGGHLAYRTDRMDIGVSGLYTAFGGSLDRNNTTYNRFAFAGQSNFNVSFDYNVLAGPFNLFGESAISERGGMAHLHGVMAELDARVRMVAVVRKYDADYHALLANGFGEGGGTNNEMGTIFGVETKISKNIDVLAYADFYRWNWLGFRRDGLGNGQDYLIQLNYRPDRRTYIYARYKWESKPFNFSDEEMGIDVPIAEVRQQVRLHFDRRIGTVKLRSRIEWIGYDPNDDTLQQGYMLYQDFVWRLKTKPLTIAVRYALFQTDNYDTRIYAYENDVLYAFSIPAYYYRGSRTYLTVKYSPSGKIDMWFRIGRFFYNDRDEISSGLNMIEGNTRTEVKAQVRLKF